MIPIKATVVYSELVVFDADTCAGQLSVTGVLIERPDVEQTATLVIEVLGTATHKNLKEGRTGRPRQVKHRGGTVRYTELPLSSPRRCVEAADLWFKNGQQFLEGLFHEPAEVREFENG